MGPRKSNGIKKYRINFAARRTKIYNKTPCAHDSAKKREEEREFLLLDKQPVEALEIRFLHVLV